MSKFYAVVVEGAEHIKHYETASNWSRHILTPGQYEIVPVDIRYNETTPDKAYYGLVRVPGVMVESYFVNRLFAATSVDHKTDLAELSVSHFAPYWYQVKDGESYGNIFTIVQVDD